MKMRLTKIRFREGLHDNSLVPRWGNGWRQAIDSKVGSSPEQVAAQLSDVVETIENLIADERGGEECLKS